ncbi:reverse transcriptase domain-containing protein [Tanacetum coccineum]
MQGVSKTDFENYVKANDAILRNMQNQGQGLQNQMTNLTKMLSKFVNSNTASSSVWELPKKHWLLIEGGLEGNSTLKCVAYKGPIDSTLLSKVVEREDEINTRKPWPILEKINLMPYSVWKNLSLPELTPTCMTLELADRSISEPIGIAEDVYVTVGKFQFPADFVVVDFEPDPRVPLILGRSFLKTSRALIDVYEGEITLRVGREAITFNLDQTSRYTANYNHMTANRIDVIDMACEEYSQEVLWILNVISSGNPTRTMTP